MKKFLFVLLLSVLMASTSCNANPNAPLERTYVSTEITYSEPIEKYAFRSDMDFTETENAKYYFEPSVGNDEREACMEATEKALSNQASRQAPTEIYIFSQNRYDYKYIYGNKLFCPVRDWRSADYITDVLLTAYGKTTHYGTAFGYASYLANKYEWESRDGKFSNPSVHDVLDLNYLCFDENFTSADDISVAKEISCDFVESYIGQFGEQQLQKLISSSVASADALEKYYAQNGVTYSPSEISYGCGGKSYDYIVYSDLATFYVQNDWIDTHAAQNPLITESFLHADYVNTKAFFETNLHQMKQYQNLFDLDDDNNDLEIVFTKSISGERSSFYHGTEHRIYLYNVDSLMHEYIHSLTKPFHTMPMWKVEGLARYFSYYYDIYGMAFLNQDYNNTPDVPELKYVHEYLAAVNRPIDIAKDYKELENIVVYSRSWTNPNENYITGSSFVQYLVKQYGEKAVIHSIYGNGDPLPVTYAELVKMWNESIENNYSAYSKYK